MNILKNLPESLLKENGCGLFVCIWRTDGSVDVSFKGSVQEWLIKPENQSGTWLIDGGWGGPPGPIHVKWDEKTAAWLYGGYCGRLFT